MTLYISDAKLGIKKSYEHCAPVNQNNLDIQIKWCQDNFIRNTWKYYDHQGVIYFEHEKDMSWFKLRWQ